MDKQGKKELNKSKNTKNPKLSKIPKKDNLTKENPGNTILKASKKKIQETKENLKSNNKQQNINITSKKLSMDTKTKNSNTNFNTNLTNNNNMTDSLEVLKEKKKTIKKEIYNKKLNLKTKNKNSEEKAEGDLCFNNKDNNNYEVNPFLKNINSSNNNLNKKSNKKISSSINKEKDKNKDIKIININKNKINSHNLRQTYNPENPIDFSLEKNLKNTIDNKDKINIYKNRFLTKKNKNNNNKKERKSEGSFGSIIFQKKMKLFSLSNEQIGNYFRESSISSKNIKNQVGNKENQLTEIKDDINKIPQRKKQISGKKQNKIKEKISNNKLNKLDNNINKNNIDNSNYKENKKLLKLETKINKNREILFNSKGKTTKEKPKNKNKNTFKLIFPNIKKNNNNNSNIEPNYIITKNTQKNNINSKKIFEKRITYFAPKQNNNNIGNKTMNLTKNKNNLCYSNCNMSKIKLEEKIENKSLKELKDSINKDSSNKDKENNKVIMSKKNKSPPKINIDLQIDKFQSYNDITVSDKLLSERLSPENKDLLKNNSKNKNNSYSMENFSLNYKYNNNINKNPKIKGKNENNNKILRTKTEINDSPKKNKSINKINNKNSTNNNINIYLNLNIEKKIISKEIQSDKNKSQQNKIFNENMIMSLNTLDNESFKKSTVKKLIKNNQYKALLSEITAINSNKSKNKTKIKERNKEKDNIIIKKKFRFSERKRGSHIHDSKRRLTESSEKYYDLYKKAFNDNTLEQKFSFRPKSKNKDLHYNNNKSNGNDIDINDNNINKKGSRTSFAKEINAFDGEINIDDLYHKKILSNNLEKNNISDKENENEIEIESDNNKNFILDLNHFIPIDEKKLKNTISKPLYGNNK